MTVKPPIAEKRPHAEQYHGREVTDDYFWLRNRDDEKVHDYLEAENDYTAAVMKSTEPFQEALYKEMLGRIKETDLSVPERRGAFFYYTRTEEGKQYGYRCRKKGSLEADEEVLIDENALAEGHSYFDLGVYEISPDHSLLAYSVDLEGNERYTLYVKDLRAGQLLEDRIPDTYSVEWGNDNRTLFYSTLDPAHRPYRLHRHVLGSDPAGDELIYQEDNDRFFLGLYKTKDTSYIMLYLGSAVTSEVRYLDANTPSGRFAVIHPRQQGMEYGVEHWGDRFYIRTNDGAINFRLMQAPVGDPSRSNWKEVIPHRREIHLENVEIFARHMALVERKEALRTVRVLDLPEMKEHDVEFPEPVYTVRMAANPEFDTDLLRFTYESMITPDTVFDYDMKTRDRELKKEKEILGGYDRTKYRSERVFATAPDGARVPMSLVYRKGMKRNRRNPLMLYGYGAYSLTIEPGFSSARLSLLDRGFVYAIAHIRGGGALGRPWYEAGKLLNKRNTFTDFIACAEHLIAQKYTSTDRLVIRGGSAGGLLMGAVVNMRPDLFRAVVANVPFVDVINSMVDSSIPLTAIEWEEWGDPRKKEFYDYILSYSPYDNVEPKDYPDMLVTAGLNDPRVQYWEPAKWTAKLRALKTGDHLLLLKTNLDAGHAGASGRYDALKELAFEYTFVLNRLGIGS
jgi:oligopeptidase B